jgi:hypothetical protein
MEKLCCFCDIGSRFLRVFPKMQQNVCDSDIWIGTKEFAQNAGNRISEVLDFKISGGGYPRRPIQMRGLMYVYASVSSGAGSVPAINTKLVWQRLHLRNVTLTTLQLFVKKKTQTKRNFRGKYLEINRKQSGLYHQMVNFKTSYFVHRGVKTLHFVFGRKILHFERHNQRQFTQ